MARAQGTLRARRRERLTLNQFLDQWLAGLLGQALVPGSVKRTVTLRWRRKTLRSARVVPLMPQLETILRAYLSERTAREVVGNEPTRALLFPGYGERGEAIVTDFRKVLDKAAIRAGFSEPVLKGGEVMKDRQGRTQVRSTVKVHMVRHTFCAARLQTLDSGAPVSPLPSLAS